MKASVVVTVRNEARNIEALLSSLAGQQHLEEVVLVDAHSTDDTVSRARAMADRLPRLVIREEPCTRGEGRNLGAAAAHGDTLVFIDGDCVAEPGWLAGLDRALAGRPDRVVAGRTELAGRASFARLHRVELAHKGQDTTWPSCNLAYPRALFERLGGFDAAFITAEDIDLNYRAIAAGATIVHAPDAVVRARTRDGLAAFLRQAYWNGYGRKQLTAKHGRLWREYRFRRLVRLETFAPAGVLRLGAGLAGYLAAKFRLGRMGRARNL